MLSNLLDNAINYTPVHGRIALHLSLSLTHRLNTNDAACALLVIEDNGPGIAPADREKVFEPFYRAIAAGEMNPTGTGLGLSIVREIVALHHGQIRLHDGTEGKGLRIEIILPL